MGAQKHFMLFWLKSGLHDLGKLEAERQYKLRIKFGTSLEVMLQSVLGLKCLDSSWITFLFSSPRSVTLKLGVARNSLSTVSVAGDKAARSSL